MTALPRPRLATDQHWCDTCRPCPHCAGGTLRIPRHGHWRAVIHPSGACWAVCTGCNGSGLLCPVRDRQQAAEATQ